MMKLLKYEVRGDFKKFLIIFGAFVLIIFAMPVFDKTAVGTITNNPLQIAYGVVFILTIINFQKEMNSSSGYLTFSLPVKKSHILAVKLINYLSKLIIIFASIILLNLWCILLGNTTFSELVNEFINIKWDLLYYCMVSILDGVMYILIMWLIMVICKTQHLGRVGSTALGVGTFILIIAVIGFPALLTLRFQWVLPVHSLGRPFGIIQIGEYGNLTFEIYKMIVIAILFIITAGLFENRAEI